MFNRLEKKSILLDNSHISFKPHVGIKGPDYTFFIVKCDYPDQEIAEYYDASIDIIKYRTRITAVKNKHSIRKRNNLLFATLMAHEVPHTS